MSKTIRNNVCREADRSHKDEKCLNTVFGYIRSACEITDNAKFGEISASSGDKVDRRRDITDNEVSYHWPGVTLLLLLATASDE